MDRSLTIQSDSFPFATVEDQVLSRISDNLRDAIAHRRMISDRTVFDFCRLTTKLLYGGIAYPLPVSFSELAKEAEDYWFYTAKDDRNKDRCFTYIRIYQITSMVRTAEAEEQRQAKLMAEAQTLKNKGTYEVLFSIYNSPGITHKMLSQYLGVTASALTQKAARLEKSGYLFSKRNGRNKSYSLSNYGISLFKQMQSTGVDNIALTKMHLEFVAEFFSVLSDNIDEGTKTNINEKKVLALIQRVFRTRQNDVEHLIEWLKHFRTGRDHNFSNDLNRIPQNTQSGFIQYIRNKDNKKPRTIYPPMTANNLNDDVFSPSPTRI